MTLFHQARTWTIALGLAALAATRAAAQSPAQADDAPVGRPTAGAGAAKRAREAGRARARAAAARGRPAGALPDPLLNARIMDLPLPRSACHESGFTEVALELSQEFPWPGS